MDLFLASVKIKKIKNFNHLFFFKTLHMAKQKKKHLFV